MWRRPKTITLGSGHMRDLLNRSSTTVGRHRIELSQGAVDVAVRMMREQFDRVERKIDSMQHESFCDWDMPGSPGCICRVDHPA